MNDVMQTMRDRNAAQHAVEVARGEHDDRCEWRADGFYLCHCSKRARIAAGYTEPPGELIFRDPYCPRCDADVFFDGDVWRCDHCRCHWDSDGSEAEFYDDHGDDLAADLAKWETAHARHMAEQEAT